LCFYTPAISKFGAKFFPPKFEIENASRLQSQTVFIKAHLYPKTGCKNTLKNLQPVTVPWLPWAMRQFETILIVFIVA
jgi:hypothetical protein